MEDGERKREFGKKKKNKKLMGKEGIGPSSAMENRYNGLNHATWQNLGILKKFDQANLEIHPSSSSQ